MAAQPRGAAGRAGRARRPARSSSARARTDRRIPGSTASPSRLVVGGGIVIIAAILAILFVILVEIYPLFKAPVAQWMTSHRMVASRRAMAHCFRGPDGVDEYREVAFAVTGGSRGAIHESADGRCLAGRSRFRAWTALAWWPSIPRARTDSCSARAMVGSSPRREVRRGVQGRRANRRRRSPPSAQPRSCRSSGKAARS